MHTSTALDCRVPSMCVSQFSIRRKLFLSHKLTFSSSGPIGTRGNVSADVLKEALKTRSKVRACVTKKDDGHKASQSATQDSTSLILQTLGSAHGSHPRPQVMLCNDVSNWHP